MNLRHWIALVLLLALWVVLVPVMILVCIAIGAVAGVAAAVWLFFAILSQLAASQRDEAVLDGLRKQARQGIDKIRKSS